MYGAGRIFRSTTSGKVGNREMRRRAVRSMQEGSKIYALLLAVLAQKGGEIVVTQGTIDQVGANLANLGYRIDPILKDNDLDGNPQPPTDFIIRLTEGTDSLEQSEQPVGVESVRDPLDGRPDVDHLGE